MNHHCYTLANGFVGIIASMLGFISTFQVQLEWWVRMTGGIMGIIIAGITLWNLLKPKSRP
jgi:cytochrome c biogenesis protein CcdA